MNPDEVEFKSLTAQVKAIETENPNGEFEAILSTSATDRDFEQVAPGAFNPLPASIPIYHQHDWMEKALPIGRGVPSYDDDGNLVIKGTYAASDRAQEVRALVGDGIVDSMSPGFVNSTKKSVKGGRIITSGDLIEASFTAVPVNRTALVTGSKSLDVKAGARNSAADMATIQAMHDNAVELGATCAAGKSLPAHGDVTYTATDDGESFTFGDPEVDVADGAPEDSTPAPEAPPAAPAAPAAGAAGKSLPAADEETDGLAQRARALAVFVNATA